MYFKLIVLSKTSDKCIQKILLTSGHRHSSIAVLNCNTMLNFELCCGVNTILISVCPVFI